MAAGTEGKAGVELEVDGVAVGRFVPRGGNPQALKISYIEKRTNIYFLISILSPYAMISLSETLFNILFAMSELISFSLSKLKIIGFSSSSFIFKSYLF